MTLTVKLPTDVERALTETAERTGQTVAELAAAILAHAARASRGAHSVEQMGEVAMRLTALGRIGSYDTRARAGLAPLANEALSREVIYEGSGL